MKKFLLIASIFVIGMLTMTACGNTPVAYAGGGTNQNLPMLSASGTGQVYLVPDVAYVNIGVRVDANEVSAALSANNVQAGEISAALQALGVEAKDIQGAHNAIIRVQNIYHFLSDSLDMRYEISNNLYALYQFILG